MRPNIPGFGRGASVSRSGGHKRGRKKRKTKTVRGHVMDVLIPVLIGLALYLAIEAVPYVLKLEDGDVMRYSDASILGKWDALRDGMRHKREISEVKFSHDGKKVTLTYEKGVLTDVSGEGYGEGDAGEYESDLAETRRLLKEWRLD